MSLSTYARHLTLLDKHPDSSEDPLTSVAGSFGYVAPEVPNQNGHGKPVDLWSTGYGYVLPLPIIYTTMEC